MPQTPISCKKDFGNHIAGTNTGLDVSQNRSENCGNAWHNVVYYLIKAIFLFAVRNKRPIKSMEGEN